MSTTTYDVRAHREDKWWTITVPALGAVTQARRVGEIHEMAVDLIHALTEADPAGIAIDLHVELPDDVADAWTEAKALQERAEADQARAAELRRRAVRALRDRGLTQTETGEVLGVSYQRVQQLAKN